MKGFWYTEKDKIVLLDNDYNLVKKIKTWAKPKK